MRIKECNIEEIMLEEYRDFSERSFRNTKGKNEFEEDKKSTALVEIRAEILQQLQVSATEFEKQIQIFKNSFGYAAAKQVKDMGEITISYTEHTMTIPCYMTVNKKVVKFDVIYNMNKKTWRFEPW